MNILFIALVNVTVEDSPDFISLMVLVCAVEPPPPPDPPPLVVVLEPLLELSAFGSVTVADFDFVTVTDDDVPEAVIVFTQPDAPCSIVHDLDASPLCKSAPTSFVAVWPDETVQPPEPLHVNEADPKSPPAMNVADTSNSSPSSTEEAEVETEIVFIATTFTLVSVTNVSELLSINIA